MKRMTPVRCLSAAALLAVAGASCESDKDPPPSPAESALKTKGASRLRTAVLKTALGKEVAQVTFAQLGEHRVSVLVTVDYPGARAGFHGIHIHANDNPANGEGCVADPAAPANTHFVSADGHFNPTSTTHGRHGGDFPNVALLDDGRAVLAFLDDVDLDALANRALILHEDIDNHGHVPTGALPTQYTANSPEAVTLTLATGNAGNRIACGLIR